MASPYPRRRSRRWFIERWAYQRFVLRELSGVVLAAYMVLLLLLVSSVHAGGQAFADHVTTLRSPLMIAVHVILVLFALLHTVTWFQAVPKGLPLRRGEEKVPPALMIGANYVAMAGATVIIVAALVA
ncbi:MAG: hypothetical protein FJZ92_08215 [Chloroflexi bacterium]|nr:hypothetical protein [Chloroflexota bacterium]